MKVLLTSDDYFPLIGGGQVHVRELRRHLEAAGHATRLFTNQPGTSEDEEGIVRHVWRGDIFKMTRKLDALIREFKPDVIAAHYSYRLAAAAGVLARLHGIPMTVTLHGLGTLPEAHAGFRQKISHAVYRKVSLLAASRIISTSQDLLDVAARYISSKKMTVIPNAASARQFDPAVWDKDPGVAALRQKFQGRKIILTVRRLNPKCGIQYLVEAMPAIVKRHPDVLYAMVGTGRMEDEIRRRVKELGLEKNILMTGAVPNDETARYFSVSDVVVFPSTAESTSISCIEAMLMGKVVVASAVGGLIELLGRDGARGRLVQLVDWESSNYEAPPVSAIPATRLTAMADAVSDLLDDPEDRNRLGQAARTHALANYDWQVVAAKTIKEYERLIA
jgi:glycosyltransferase involved in cell wall biosynthesis